MHSPSYVPTDPSYEVVVLGDFNDFDEGVLDVNENRSRFAPYPVA